MRQAALKVPEPKQDSRSLHEILLDILKEFGPRKQEHLVAQLGASKGHLSEVLSGHKHWPQEWIDYIVDHYDFRSDVARYYARRRGLVVVPPRKMSALEELRRLKYALTQHNGLGRVLMDEALALPDEVFADDEVES
jgi:hypothetical protein